MSLRVSDRWRGRASPSHLLWFVAIWCSFSPVAPRFSLPGLGELRTWATGTSEQLVDCVNAMHQPLLTTTWEGAMANEMASLAAAGAWWSSKPLHGPLTVVTQASASRITQLWAQCKSWPGPLSAAVHLTLGQQHAGQLSARNRHLLQRTRNAVASFHANTERDANACRLDLILVYEVVKEKRAAMLYPVNQLRNLARLQARTDLVAMMDVDMLVSSKLARSLQKSEQANTMLTTCKAHTVYVLPAFEAAHTKEAEELEDVQALADNMARQSKAFLVKSVNKKIILPFDHARFALGHNATLFDRWYGTDTQYEVDYKARYEPWIIAARRDVPWHDCRFRGYGQNKIVQIAATNASRFKFVVHATGFIIHRGHQVTAAREQIVNDMKIDHHMRKDSGGQLGISADTLYGHGMKVWLEAKSAMDAGVYEAVLDAASKHCMQVLPWWRL